MAADDLARASDVLSGSARIPLIHLDFAHAKRASQYPVAGMAHSIQQNRHRLHHGRLSPRRSGREEEPAPLELIPLIPSNKTRLRERAGTKFLAMHENVLIQFSRSI